MLKIRLKRIGKKRQPVYRLVVSDVRKDMQGPYKEQVGFYNPLVSSKDVKADETRINYWLSQGAKCSPTVHNLLVSKGIIKGKKVKATKIKKVKSQPATAKAAAAQANPAAKTVIAQAPVPASEAKTAASTAPGETVAQSKSAKEQDK
jgi:small subunit ribosomal protein S16